MLKESKGNMYEFVTHTWNPIVGRCPHDCKYCYVLYKYSNEVADGIRLNEEPTKQEMLSFVKEISNECKVEFKSNLGRIVY